MKKFYCISLALFALVAISVSCSKVVEDPVNPQEEVNPSEESTQLTIAASIAGNMTRVNFTAGETGLALTWNSDDKLLVANSADPTQNTTFDLTSGAGEKDATFTGTLNFSADSYDVSVVNTLNGNYAVQQQKKDGDLTKLQYIATKTVSSVSELANITFDKVSSVLGLASKLPAGTVADIESVDITASESIFNSGKTLRIELEEFEDADNDQFLKIYAALPPKASGDVVSIPAGTTLLIKFNAPNTSHTVYTRLVELPSSSFNPGEFNEIKINCTKTDQHAGLVSCDGSSAEKAYLIGDKYQMDAMHQLMVRGEKKYFKLIDDIEMTDIVWFPLNNGYPESGGTKYSGNVYDKELDFNGNNHQISNLVTKSDDLDSSDDYASVFGVLMGNVYDLTIDHATIHPQGKSGILAGYVGTGSYGPNHCEVTNVTIKNSTLTEGASYCGALAGQSAKNGNEFSNIVITDCTISTSSYAAGLVAYFANSATVSDILVSGTVITSSGHSKLNNSGFPEDGFAGGIAARVNAAVDFDRCIFSGGTIIGPTQANNDNSKLNRFVGGLVAYVDNKASTFDDCEVVDVSLGIASAPASNNFRYVGGAFGYLGAAAVVGETTGCSVENLSTNNNVRNYVGGFVSYLDGAIVKNSTATSESTIGNNQYSGGVGGFVGYCVGGTLYNNMASVDVQGAGNPGGFVGWVETTAASFEKCSASGSVVAGANNAGGFCGIDKIGSTYTECNSSGLVTSTAGYVGGLIGFINADGAIVKNCYSTSTITASGNYVGGLVGVSESDTIEESYYEGTVTGNSRVGGILGISLKDDAVTIKNCYSRGEVVGAATEQRYGGIVGDLGKGGIVENCWSDAEVTGGRVIGGIVGLACYQTWADNTVANNTITGCIAWNPKVKAAQLGNYGSSGAVIGHTSFKNVFGNCYRRSDMEYQNSFNCSGGEWNSTMVDQPNCDGTNWAKGTTPGTNASYQYQQPYYGVAAASTDTVSSIAQSLGWSSDIWDFTGDLPVMKIK